MNDRFKFRGYWYNDVQKEWWVYDEPEFITGDGTAEIWYNSEGGAEPELPSFAELHLCQCTGLKDKNGKLIYEGDILKKQDYNALGYYRERICTVFWWDILAGWAIETTLGDAYRITDYEERQLEVIGNIYENKELLND